MLLLSVSTFDLIVFDGVRVRGYFRWIMHIHWRLIVECWGYFCCYLCLMLVARLGCWRRSTIPRRPRCLFWFALNGNSKRNQTKKTKKEKKEKPEGVFFCWTWIPRLLTSSFFITKNRSRRKKTIKWPRCHKNKNKTNQKKKRQKINELRVCGESLTTTANETTNSRLPISD